MAKLLITVNITYGGEKARSLVPGYTSQQDVIRTLRTDLTVLRNPYPKAESIELHSIGCITCYWTSQERNPITKRLRQIQWEESIGALHNIKQQQSIESIVITEEPVPSKHELSFTSPRTMNYHENMRPFQYNNSPPVRSMNSTRMTSSTMEFDSLWQEPERPASGPNLFSPSASEVQTGHPESMLLPVAQDFLADTSDIDRLGRALGQIREQIAAAKAIESSLLDHLNRLRPFVVTEPQIEMDTNSSLTTRLQITERSLQTERKKRIEAEQALEDIERECKEPFIVPALLKGFIEISKLTSEY